jgi:hypothetical protein
MSDLSFWEKVKAKALDVRDKAEEIAIDLKVALSSFGLR